jgi:peptidoglycan/xylan/chitin deacetylase (PgdA/CDA1 family)
LLELRDAGWEIGSHTVTHARLPELDDESCRDELVRSRQLITEVFGRCETVAYPYGAADARVARVAAEAGYLAGCTLSYVHRVDEPFRRPRFDASAAGGRLRQWAKLSAAARVLRRSPLVTLRR